MPMAKVAVKPTPMPKATRPGASAFSPARDEAVTGEERVSGLVTPMPRVIRSVLAAVAPMDTHGSPKRAGESTKNAVS